MIKKSKPRAVRIIFIGIGLVFLACLLAFATQLMNVPMRVSKETTYVTEPLLPDGRVDFVAAFENATLSDQVATENNGYRLFIDQFPNPGFDPDDYAVLRGKLGLPAKQTLSVSYESSEAFLEQYFSRGDYDASLVEAMATRQGFPDFRDVFYLPKTPKGDDYRGMLEKLLRRPWIENDFPPLQNWIQENSQAMDLLAEVVRKPEFDIPLIPQNDQLHSGTTPEIHRFRELQNDFVIRANFYLGTGQIDKAIDDCMTLKRLGRHLRRSGMLLHMVVGSYIEYSAPGIASCLEHQPTAEQLDRYIEFLLAQKTPNTIADVAFELRLGQLSEVDSRMHDESSNMIGIDGNAFARKWNQLIEAALLATESGLVQEEEQQPETTLEFSDIFRKYRSEKAAAVLVKTPNFNYNQEGLDRPICQSNMELISLAILRYEKDHQTLPPAFLADDNGQPLHSWRTLLLPYLGQQELYDQIRLDEPWDSQHNRQFWHQRPAAFHCPSHEDQSPELTSYSVAKGAESAFQGSTGKKLTDFGEYSSNLILVIERKETCNWMDPTQDSTLQ